MGIDLATFVQLRPRLFHLTASGNVAGILESGRMESARVLMERAGDTTILRRKRVGHLVLRGTSRGGGVHIRDQRPLHAGNVLAEDGFEFEDVVEMLNERVFFWPGNERGPIPAGRNHFARYAGEDCKVLVIETAAMLAANTGVQFCRFNSGAPRCNRGKKSPRGKGTFVLPRECEFSAGEVQEVVFVGGVELPAGAVRVASAI